MTAYLIKTILTLVLPVVLYSLFLLIGILLQKIRVPHLFEIKHKLIASMTVVVIYCLLPVFWGTVVYLLLFLLYRLLFRNDARRMTVIYNGSVGKQKEYPTITALSQVFPVLNSPVKGNGYDKDFAYSLKEHMECLWIVFAMQCLDIVRFSGISDLMTKIELYLIATFLFVVIAEFLYDLFLNSPRSVFFLSPRLSYIPVLVVGAIYYFVASVIIFHIV